LKKGHKASKRQKTVKDMGQVRRRMFVTNPKEKKRQHPMKRLERNKSRLNLFEKKGQTHPRT